MRWFVRLGLAWRQIKTTFPSRAGLAARDALATALACALAWILAVWLWGHPHPTFAVVTAVVCLAPGLPSHLKQARNLVIGCALGIVMGELMWKLPDTYPLVRMSVGMFFAILMGAVIGPAPVVPIQAGVSVALVLAMGPSTAGSTRLLEVLLGAAVGLLFSQVLFTSNPFKDMGRATSAFLRQIGNGLDRVLKACEAQDGDAAQAATGHLSQAQESLAALRAAVAEAQVSKRWSLRGRLNADRLAVVTRRYDRHAVRVYATALLLAESLGRATSHTQAPLPPPVKAYCQWLSDSCMALAKQAAVVILNDDDQQALMGDRPHATATGTDALLSEWRVVQDNAQQLEYALRALLGSGDA
ncbi:aromatic acid exporter family protein [Achromobacter xylosoxidans]|uniref:FUSC family protein n=1 Tax=Alcaligenes xylosoxydans xylosoxydans TaxID=85698 RepID=UPI0012321FE3|nr:FUSC family protein [Achromobacter xylosoxidans]KAA5921763.1 aromatic acid exporter family protein [Achromobacter xylosoxidans]